MTQMPILTQRRIEAAFAKDVYAEMQAELGAILSCNRDGAFCEGWNGKLKLIRAQTLMGGATHCDFRYVMEA